MKATFVNLTHEKPTWAKDFLVMNSARPLSGTKAEFQSTYVTGSHYALIDLREPNARILIENNLERGAVCINWDKSKEHFARYSVSF